MITCGCLMWGVMTVAFSQCDSVMQGYIFWGENRSTQRLARQVHLGSEKGVKDALIKRVQVKRHVRCRHQWNWAVNGDPQRAEHGG